MPLTPFIGLSVMVHIGVIAVNRFFGWTPAKSELKDGKHAKVTRVIGFAIIAVVFTVVITSAVVLVHASITDQHSSIRFVGEVTEGAYNSFFSSHPIPPIAENSLAATFTNISASTSVSAPIEIEAVVNTAPVFDEKEPPHIIASAPTVSYASVEQLLETEKIILLNMESKLESSSPDAASLDE